MPPCRAPARARRAPPAPAPAPFAANGRSGIVWWRTRASRSWARPRRASRVSVREPPRGLDVAELDGVHGLERLQALDVGVVPQVGDAGGVALGVQPVAAQRPGDERDVPVLGHPQPAREVERREVLLAEGVRRHRGAPQQRGRAADAGPVQHRGAAELLAGLQRRPPAVHRPVDVAVDDLAVLVDQVEAGVGHPGARVAVQGLDRGGDQLGVHLVVVAQLDHVVGARAQQRAGEVADDARVVGVLDQPHPWIVVARDDVADGRARGRVVVDLQAQVGEALGQHALDRAAEPARAIVRGNTYGDAGSGGHGRGR